MCAMRRKQLQESLARVSLARRFYYFHEIGSTSDWAKELVRRAGKRADLHGTVIIAEHQTSGRGRHNRQWSAPFGKALLFSIILSPAGDSLPGLAIPVAVAEALRSTTGANAEIKYPNDILVDRRKVGGILLEQESCGEKRLLVAGIGINCNQDSHELPPQARIAATSLRLATGCQADISEIVGAIIDRIDYYLDPMHDGALHTRMSSLCTTIGKIVEIHTQTEQFGGTAMAITSDGALVVRTESGIQRLVYSGDVRQLTMNDATDA